MKKSKNNQKIKEKVFAVAKKEYASSVEYQLSKGFSDIAAPDDKILAKHGYNLKIYRSLLSDEQVKACYLNQRIAGVIAAPWEVVPAGDTPQDEAVAEFVRQNLNNIDFNEICRKMLYATWYGFQVAEIMWGIKDNRIVIEDIIVRNLERFRFRNDGALYLVRNYLEKEIMPDKKFWVLKNSGDNDDDIYGIGLGHICYWPIYLKRNGLKFWSILVEKFAVPTAVGKYPQFSSDMQIRELLQSLDAIATETSIAVPEGTEVQLLEAVKSSGGDHEKFCKYLDQILAKAILGQDGTSENGRYAGTAAVQADVKDLILKADADLLNESLAKTVIKWLVEFNFPGCAAPTIIRSFEQPENLKEAAEQDNLIYAMGFKPTKSYIESKYGGEWEEQSQPLPQAENSAEFAENEPLNNDFADEWVELVSPTMQPIMETAANSKNFTEFNKKLLELYQNINVNDTADKMALDCFKARLDGMSGDKDHA